MVFKAYLCYFRYFWFLYEKAIDINLFWMGNNTVGITYEYF